MSEKIRNKTNKRQKNCSRQGGMRASAQEQPSWSAGTSTWGKRGVKATVLGRGQVRGGLFHGLYPGSVVVHQNALKGLAKTPCAGPTHQVLIQTVWGGF